MVQMHLPHHQRISLIFSAPFEKGDDGKGIGNNDRKESQHCVVKFNVFVCEQEIGAVQRPPH